MSEIEEIKERLVDYKMEVLKLASRQAVSDIQTLLSSLNVRDNEIKALEGLRMSLRDEIIGLESSLEKEKERADKAEEEKQNWIDLCSHAEERVKELSDEKLNRHDEVMMWVEKCNQAELHLSNLMKAVEENICKKEFNCVQCDAIREVFERVII